MGQSLTQYLLLTEKKWHDELFSTLVNAMPDQWQRINKREEFTHERLLELQPSMIFIPHWSYIIPENIYKNYDCVVFHMTDLPYGRGGSPLQNLIVNGHTHTKISALRVVRELDAGDVYLKKELLLCGSASEIFKRSSAIIEGMIKEIIHKKIIPQPQKGIPTIFKRRTPEEGNLQEINSLMKVYDYIRMLDAEGYPNAYLETKDLRFEFREASMSDDGQLSAYVRISKK